MTSSVIYEQGTAEITVPATESIAVFTRGSAKVYQKVGYPTFPETVSLLGTVSAGQTVFGAYASGATIIIEAGAAEVFYEVGFSPLVAQTINTQYQPAPTAKTVAVTLTIAELLTGIITGTHAAGATAAYTLPTGALTDAAAQWAINDSFDWSIINLSAAAVDTITLTASTTHTIVGNPIVQSAHSSTGGIYGNSARWRTRKTAADTFVTYRIA